MIIWITGLAGSGKTTIAKALYEKIKANNPRICLIDGDVVRSAFDNDLGYSEQDRKINLNRIQKIGKILDDQDFVVIISVLYNNEEDRKWNRKNYKKYIEIFIDTSMEIILKRNQKNLYSDFDKGLIKNVVGRDINYDLPKNSDLTIDGDGEVKNNVEKIYNLYQKL